MAAVQIPRATSIVKVFIIDTSARMSNLPTQVFFGPDLEGFTRFHGGAFTFLIVHTDSATGKERRLIFDLGPAKDWQNDLAEPLVERVKQWGATIDISKYVSEILVENGISLDSIEAVVWSHDHWDHTGRVSLFPSSVDLITGPGVKQAFYPGYPTVASSTVLERDFADRNVRELDFNDGGLTIGQFQALDYFGDGSFYFLSAPGHAVGHINALARTTTSSTTSVNAPDADESTFILMGADSFHHGSQLRPNAHTHLPDSIPGPLPNLPQYVNMCPGHIFDVVHPSHPQRKPNIPPHYTSDLNANHSDPRKSPFFTVASTPEGTSIAVDLQAAKDTIKTLQQFDAMNNVFLVAAHDDSLFGVLDFFPQSANDWQTKGWKEQGRWRFLSDLHESVLMASK